ncbi:MAG: NADH-quinone oxidoreductase subunit NuoK [Dehalococcoidia bacterium]|nr:MAG: NADH-quinone oxidoreductase subunit NuoK [Dehalococcoidia bacterium]
MSWWLTVSAVLFAIGVYGALSRRNAIGILMGVELILNAANINLVAFWRYVIPTDVSGQIFALTVITVAAAEAAVGLAIVIAVYRSRKSAEVEELDMLKQ